MSPVSVLFSGSGVPPASALPPPPLPSLPPLEEVFERAFERYLARFDVLSGVVMVPAIFFLIGELFFISSSPITGIVGFFFILLSLLFTLILLPRALTAAAYSDTLDVEAAYRDAFDTFAPSFPILILLVSVLLAGLSALGIPFIVFLVWFSFTFFTALADKREWFSALASSREYVRGHFWYVLLHLLSVLAVVFAPYAGYHVMSDGLPGPLGSFIRALLGATYVILVPPFFFAYWSVLFSRLRSLHGGAAPALPSSPVLSQYVTVFFVLVGFVLLIILLVLAARFGFSSFTAFVLDTLDRLYLIRP